MFGRSPKPVRFAPAPWNTPVQVPRQFPTLPLVFVQSHDWPKQSLRRFEAAVADPKQCGIPRGSYFLPAEAYKHPYSSPSQSQQAVAMARRKLATLQEAAVHRHMAGMPLTHQQAAEIMSISTPQSVDYQAIRRAQARAAGAPALSARQLPAYVINYMPPALFKAYAALQQGGRVVNGGGNVISRTRQPDQLMGKTTKYLTRGLRRVR